MPGSGLDPSWKLAINQAVASGFAFGSDIVFTFGPYAALQTKVYHPATDGIVFVAGIYLALSYWGMYIYALRGIHLGWTILLIGFLGSLMYSMDALLLSYPLLAGFAILQIKVKEGDVRGVDFRTFALVVFAFAPFGLLPLVKGTLLALCVGVITVSAAYFLFSRQAYLIWAVLIAPVVSLVSFWLGAGQDLGDLPIFFASMRPIISGFTQAMSLVGESGEIVTYVTASVFILIAITTNRDSDPLRRVCISLLASGFLFVCFKGGFVRHDGHAVLSGTAILLAALLLPAFVTARWSIAVLVAAFICWAQIDIHFIGTSTRSVKSNLIKTYQHTRDGLSKRLADEAWPASHFEAALASINKESGLLRREGPTDIYSFRQAFLIGAGFEWSPRPVFQSYSAYTPDLILKNASHLFGTKTPENVLFKVETIDKRFPSMDDGVSWPILLQNYDPYQFTAGYSFLKRKSGGSVRPEIVEISAGEEKLGERVVVPQREEPVYVQLWIEPTVVGRILSSLYKPAQMDITVALNDGRSLKYRVVPAMSETGFLLSPLIEDTEGFVALYSAVGKNALPKVEGFTVSARDSWLDHWKPAFRFRFSTMMGPSGVERLDR